eukprot:11005205-Karenia_brevis.AAC.1
MIFSACDDQPALVAYVPDQKKNDLDATEWIKQVLEFNNGKVCEGAFGVYVRGFIKAGRDENKFPLKMKEPSITRAISCLRGKGLFSDT